MVLAGSGEIGGIDQARAIDRKFRNVSPATETQGGRWKRLERVDHWKIHGTGLAHDEGMPLSVYGHRSKSLPAASAEECCVSNRGVLVFSENQFHHKAIRTVGQNERNNACGCRKILRSGGARHKHIAV